MRIWRQYIFKQVTSTMDVAREILNQDPCTSTNEGIAIQAAEQTNGRGRHLRPWSSPPGNFYGSFIFTPCLTGSNAPLYSFTVALALYNAIDQLVKETASLHIKWPNDLLLNGKKIAGILLERPEMSSEQLIVGIGVNLVSGPLQPTYPATDLRSELNVDISPQQFYKTLIPHLNAALDLLENNGFAGIRQAWLKLRYPQDLVCVKQQSSTDLQGTFIDLDEQGRLVLQDSRTAQIHAISAGDLYFPAR